MPGPAGDVLLALEDRIKTAVGRPSRHRATAARRGSEGGSDAALAGVVFAGALYGGFFGAGLGIVVLAPMGLVSRRR